VLCPSFYRADIVRNPTWWDRTLHRVRRTVIGWFAHVPEKWEPVFRKGHAPSKESPRREARA
jgi:indolepyruvate ferredoxin oxidoreductase alpha subunit